MRHQYDLVWNPNRDLLGWNLSDLFSPAAMASPKPTFVAKADVSENESHYEVHLDVPGISQSDIKISMENDCLTISGERKNQPLGEKEVIQLSERSTGKFERRFEFGTAVQADKVEAFYADGVLKVTVPKAEQAKPRQIEIKVGGFKSEV